MLRTGVVLAIAVLAAGGLAVLHGCTSGACCGGCEMPAPAVFRLACSSVDLTGVMTSGPCATDASLSSYLGDGTVLVYSQSSGVCHVELTFATGFTYSTDVTFASEPRMCGACKCPDYVAPTSGPFMVNNPSETCVAAPDAAADVGPPDAPAGG